MASYQAFNSVLDEFLEELMNTFPEEKQIKVYHNQYLLLKKTNSRAVCEGFMTTIQPYINDIQSKNEKIMTNSDIEFLQKLNIHKWWNTTLSDNTKDCIWQYLQTLTMLGTTITSIPANILSSIEGVAEQCASQMEGNSNGQPNLGSLFQGIQSIMGSMMDPEKK